jgi:CHRD domain
MKRDSIGYATVVAAAAAMFVTPVLGQQTPTPYAAHLTGYEETPLTLNTTGSGDFKAIVSADGTSISYMLMYRDLSSPATQSHIHFGRPAIGGGIVLWLSTIPTPQPCPPFPATIFGTLTAADVVAVSGQGIDAGPAGFAEMLEALRTGSAYANVHTTLRPGGEVRGRLGPLPVTGTTSED